MTGCLTERLQVITSSQQVSVLLRSSSSTRRPPSSRRRRTIGLLVTVSLLGGKIRGHLVHEQFQDADGLGALWRVLLRIAVRKEGKLRGTIVIRNLLGTHGNLADGRTHLTLEETTPT